MKIFKFEKSSQAVSKEDICNIEISQNDKFNYIVINNPKDSNCICVVNNLICSLQQEDTIVHLMEVPVTKECRGCFNVGNLNIACELNIEDIEQKLELQVVNIHDKRDFDILQDDFLIILPGGNLYLKLDTPQDKITLGIALGEQII